MKHVVAHYSSKRNTAQSERKASPILNLKAFQNWLKAALINKYVEKGSNVVDIACGKGGDARKFAFRNLSTYLGIDVTPESIKDFQERLRNQRQKLARRVVLEVADCFVNHGNMASILSKWRGSFDVCTCQFALHYAWSSPERANQALANVATLLKHGGLFIATLPSSSSIARRICDKNTQNGIYKIDFGNEDVETKCSSEDGNALNGVSYNFTLVDAIDNCQEWVVSSQCLISIASEHGLRLVRHQPFMDIAQDFDEEFRHLKKTMAVQPLSKEEEEVASLYPISQAYNVVISQMIMIMYLHTHDPECYEEVTSLIKCFVKNGFNETRLKKTMAKKLVENCLTTVRVNLVRIAGWLEDHHPP